MTASTAPLPKLPANPLGEAPDLPEDPLGHPPTPPIRVGRHGPLSTGKRAPRPPHLGPSRAEVEKLQRNKPVVVQVKQAPAQGTATPPVAKEHERLPGKPISARAREARAALGMKAEPEAAPMTPARRQAIRTDVKSRARPAPRAKNVPESSLTGAEAHAAYTSADDPAPEGVAHDSPEYQAWNARQLKKLMAHQRGEEAES